jgi:hypothetical protein
VGLNQLEVTYAYSQTNTSIDPAIVIAGAKLNLNQTSIGYTRYFSLFHRMAWVEPSIPIAVLNGSISGTNVSGSVSGAGDSNYEMAVLLKGGPALSVAQFTKYKPTTTVGVSLAVTAPTGLYSPDKVLNLSARIDGRSSLRSVFSIHLGRGGSWRLMPMRTHISIQPTLRIAAWKF